MVEPLSARHDEERERRQTFVVSPEPKFEFSLTTGNCFGSLEPKAIHPFLYAILTNITGTRMPPLCLPNMQRDLPFTG